MSWAIRLSRSVPLRSITLPIDGPVAYIQIGALAPSTISAIAQLSDEGAGWPPIDSGICSRQNSASIQAW